MPLRDVLGVPAALGYEAQLGAGQPAQIALRDGRRELSELVPPGYRVRASGAAQNLPAIPWLAVLDEEVTTTAQEGLYVVYLFTATLDQVFLSMNQGVTAHREHFRRLGDRHNRASAVAELRREAQLLRAALGPTDSSLVDDIHLGGAGFLPRGYEAGNILAKRYTVAALPSEEELHGDLDRFLVMYRDTVSIRDTVLVERPGELHTSTRRSKRSAAARDNRSPVFRPKDASDYNAKVPAQTQRRTRKHEALVRRYGEHARTLGLTPRTNVHPRDLVVNGPDAEYLIEAKTVGNNAEFAVREAIGQLFAYRHFYYREANRSDPVLVALFSEPVGHAFIGLLDEIGIGAVWLEHGTWKAAGSASPLA